MRRNRVLTGALAALLTILLLTGSALAVVDPPANTYVGDYAGVLSSDTEQHIIRQNDTLSAATGGAIVVVTVDFLDGMAIDDYAYQIFNDWGIGDSGENNGLLLLLAIGEDNYYALQGTGISRALTDSRLDDYLWNYLEEDFAAGDYDAGVRKVFDAFYNWYESYYGGLNTAGQSQPQSGAMPQEGYRPEVRNSRPARSAGVITAAVVIVVLVLLVILVAVLDGVRYSRYRSRYLLPGMPPPPRIYHPFLFGRIRRPPPPPHPPRGPGFGGMGGGPRPPMGGGARPGGMPRPPMGGGARPGGFGGGSTRGGGAGRRPGGSSPFGGAGRPSGGTGRSSGSFGGGGSRGGFGGGASRGGGVGRRR